MSTGALTGESDTLDSFTCGTPKKKKPRLPHPRFPVFHLHFLTHSLEVVALLLALKICHPKQVTLLRGNHEDPQVNALYGFRAECERRCANGNAVWTALNSVFEWLPICAVVEKSILCVHGGLGASITTLAQLAALPRPAAVDLRAATAQACTMLDALWSDPTDSDEQPGVLPNARGPNTVKYGPDRVKAFCDANKLTLIVRAHQCVQDGFEFFAEGRLLTLFSAPDYGGCYNNDGAIVIVSRDLVVLPKVSLALHFSRAHFSRAHFARMCHAPFFSSATRHPCSIGAQERSERRGQRTWRTRRQLDRRPRTAADAAEAEAGELTHV